MCLYISIINLYPYEKDNYQLDYSAFSFAFSLANSIHFHSYLSQEILERWSQTFVI